ncbi:hypothetical protein Q5P01_018494 [Channa striata]|uniref:UPAR/Ly6 domain-containing protein n=1 Tax=Channa striata TaxID=64152 RepID=A0AA88M7V9_CHASR|nr:hypothetical protein Q5P01_018494 [Channa striata]
MKTIIVQLFAVGICFAIGQALQCYNCKIGIWNLCYTTEVTCQQDEQCFSGLGKALGKVDIKMKGCLTLDKCNKSENMNYTIGGNIIPYSMNKTCCSTDLCNAAPAPPGTTGLSLVFATVAALFAANILV